MRIIFRFVSQEERNVNRSGIWNGMRGLTPKHTVSRSVISRCPATVFLLNAQGCLVNGKGWAGLKCKKSLQGSRCGDVYRGCDTLDNVGFLPASHKTSPFGPLRTTSTRLGASNSGQGRNRGTGKTLVCRISINSI